MQQPRKGSALQLVVAQEKIVGLAIEPGEDHDELAKNPDGHGEEHKQDEDGGEYVSKRNVGIVDHEGCHAEDHEGACGDERVQDICVPDLPGQAETDGHEERDQDKLHREDLAHRIRKNGHQGHDETPQEHHQDEPMIFRLESEEDEAPHSHEDNVCSTHASRILTHSPRSDGEYTHGKRNEEGGARRNHVHVFRLPAHHRLKLSQRE